MITDPAYLANTLDAILATACQCLEDNTVLGRPKDCKLYHGQPPGDCCDFLGVWLERIRPVKSFPQEWGGIVRCGEVHGAADIGIVLNRPCWPVIKDSPYSPFPPSAETDIPTTNLLIDAQALWCCMLVAGEDGKLNPDAECVDMRMGSLEPTKPKGGCAGWILRFSIEMSSCC